MNESRDTQAAAAHGDSTAAVRLTGLVLSQKVDVLAAWQDTVRMIEGGVSGEKARQLVDRIQSAVEAWFAQVTKARGLCTNGEVPESMGELDAAEKEAAQVQEAVERLKSFLNRPRRTIDTARLESGAKDIAEGRYQSAEQIRTSRLRPGG